MFDSLSPEQRYKAQIDLITMLVLDLSKVTREHPWLTDPSADHRSDDFWDLRRYPKTVALLREMVARFSPTSQAA
jgi:hypothetical protein